MGAKYTQEDLAETWQTYPHHPEGIDYGSSNSALYYFWEFRVVQINVTVYPWDGRSYIVINKVGNLTSLT